MLRLFRKYITLPASILFLVVLIGAFIMGIRRDRKYRFLESSSIDQLVSEGMTASEVALSIGQPDSEDEGSWVYRNAPRSVRTEHSYIPAFFSVCFDEKGKVELVLGGPVP
jgi:hypothetical protein